jgi:hypothetical protein
VTRAGAVAITAVLLLVAAACGGGSDDKDAKSGGKSSTTTTKTPPVAPLTGLPDPDGAAQGRPVLAIKFENTPEVRPQTGLESADVVWNEVVEGEITRFLAMYQSRSTDVVGPIRSVRYTDPLIVWPVGGIFAFSGGAQGPLDAIRAAPVNVVDEEKAGDAMFRDDSRRAPHNLFGHPDKLWALGGTPVPPPPLFTYLKTGKAPTGSPATGVSIGYKGRYSVGYTWDAASSTWMRTTEGRPFMARAGAQIATQNVVILPVAYAGGVGKEGAEAQLVGQGTAWVLSGGTATQGTWVRPDKARPMRLQTSDGTQIQLVAGTTWVELPDASYPVDVAAPAAPPSS